MPRVLVNMPSQFGGRPSGVARVAFRVIAGLVERGTFAVVLRSPWTRDQLPPAIRDRIEVVTVPRPRIMLLDVLRQAFAVPRLCRALDIDVVLNADPYGAAFGGRTRVSVVHDLYFRTLPGRHRSREALTTDPIFRLVLANSARVIAVSEATRSDLGRHYPFLRDRSHTVPSAAMLDPSACDPASDAPAWEFVLAVGNAMYNKNFGTLARAVAALGRPEVGIVHVGEDPDEAIATALDGAPVRLLRLSRIGEGRLAALYRDALCLCVPSFAEGFCLPVLEAQALGCPVVCSDRSATPEIAGAGALTFDPSDAQALTACLRRLLDEPGLRAALIARGHDNARLYDWAETARRYEALMLDALRDAARGKPAREVPHAHPAP
ncbi:Glycosyltransferase involved in cell wall bisynthesis [Methylobacterium phyllostachyos]|uniref:Glycosyltransferase involved in cell wall bisynthesis n=1 Tax=Methylobacterium phyllostachyos TaxID=582672 RepID=A0A1H0IJX3_9HYPH|nr:glycosyltransferase family 1 protein [Methylobacterium phyllostachyos]SDO31600.1 Glycosyltransferase involved in cell wall bisynthesis [Methylobacterium phyllostachyos]